MKGSLTAFAGFLLLFALFNSACGHKQVAEPSNAQPVNPKPHWVESKPTSSIYFHGIGVATKQPGSTDYLETAKKNALSDLASEIKVNVSSNSILYTLEREYKFQSEFIETIRTTTDEDLSGYEITDTWESANQYWVFYRLNKADYYAKKEAEKRAIMTDAADFYLSGQEAWSEGQIKGAFDLHVRALSILKPYWAESNPFPVAGDTILLDNRVLQDLQKMASNIDIVCKPDQIDLNLKNGFSVICAVQVSDRSTGRPLVGVPLAYRYRSSQGLVNETKNTGKEGMLSIGVENPDLKKTYNELELSVDLLELFDSRALDNDLRKVVKGLPQPENQVQINVERPVFFVESNEQNLNNRERLSILRNQMNSALISEGLPVSQVRRDADVIVDIQGKTRDGGESNGFSIAYLDMSVKFTDPSGRNILYKASYNDLKGVSNTTEKAGVKAFGKGQEKIDRRMMEEALKALI